MKRKIHLVGVAAILAVAVGLVLYRGPLWARFGNREMRQTVMCAWLNQSTPLTRLQKAITFELLYKDVDDPASVEEALAVLNSHLREDEETIVRHLVYVTFTTKSVDVRRVALSGLLQVSPKHKGIATATFLYYLKHSDATDMKDALNVSTCISGLVKYSAVEALPTIRQITNTPSKYLSASVHNAVTQLDALVKKGSGGR